MKDWLVAKHACSGSTKADQQRCPPRWRLEPFARVVDLVRAHLRPIATREMLALSYAREHFHLIAVGDAPAPPVPLSRDATEVAYALRWLELADGHRREPWDALVDPG